MSLHWIAVQDFGATAPIESDESFPLEPVFCASSVTRSPLPDDVVGEAWTDMHSGAMVELANMLEQELETHSRQYDNEVIEGIEAAITWLHFWSDENAVVVTEW